MAARKRSVERLEELLEQKDREIEELQERVYKAEDQAERNWQWTKHFEIKEDESLPVPRLEMRWREIESHDGFNWEACYNLVYRHFLGHVIAVPMGHTRIGGERNPIQNGKVDLPFRDGAHIQNDMAQLKLPGFAIFNKTITPLEPKYNTAEKPIGDCVV
jgi:hypothetical protein